MGLIEITKEATLGFYNGTGLLKIPVKQYDNARKIRIMLIDDTGEEYIIPDGIEINFKALKPDKTQINTNEVIELIDNRIIVNITDQMTVVAGIVHCELILHKDGKRITTTKFDLIVENSVHDNSHIEESADYNDVLNAIEDVKLLIEGYEKAKSDIDDFQKTLETNENERIENEQIRQNQETKRETKTQEAIDNANTATQNANDAADHAITVTDKLEDTLKKGELKAQEYYQLAESHSHGGTGIREGEDTDNADYYRRLASDSQDASKTSEDNAKISEINARDSEDAAKISEGNAKVSEDNARVSETNANASKIAAGASADSASTSAATATQKASEASVSATEADTYSTKAKSYAVGGTGTRENEDIDNAKKYYEQIKAISSSLKNALKPMGTIIFSDLPDLSNVSDGDMYNISDAFTTTENFKEGPGHVIPAGANIYKEATNGKWDVLAGTPVASVNGETGDVEITAQNITATDTYGILGVIRTDATVQELLDHTINSFQTGCDTIAAAVTSMGVTTAANTSPTIIADHIKKIKTKPTLSGNAAMADVLSGKTFYNTDSDTKITGSMKNNGAVTASISTSGGTYTIPAGYHNGNGKVTGPTLAELVSSNVTLENAGNLLSGNTAYGKNGVKYTGTMIDRSKVDSTIGGMNTSYPGVPVYNGLIPQSSTSTGDKKTRFCLQVPAGYYNGEGYVGIEINSLGNAAAGNVLAGKSFTSSAGYKVTGTMKNWTGIPNKINNRRIANNRFEVAVDAGYHGCYWAGNSYEYMELSEVASTIGLTGAQLIPGNTVCGVSSTATNRTSNTGTTNLSWAGNANGDPTNSLPNFTIAGDQLRVRIPYGWYANPSYLTCAGIAKGNLNWSGSNTTYSVPAGYYTGGTLDSRPSYNAGFNAGKAAAALIKVCDVKESKKASVTIQVNNYYSGYASLTENNFLIELTCVTLRFYNGDLNRNKDITKTYTASTGTLVIGNLGGSYNSSYATIGFTLWIRI